jgi:hypothetical protein
MFERLRSVRGQDAEPIGQGGSDGIGESEGMSETVEMVCTYCGGENAHMAEYTCLHDFDHTPMEKGAYLAMVERRNRTDAAETALMAAAIAYRDVHNRVEDLLSDDPNGELGPMTVQDRITCSALLQAALDLPKDTPCE